MKKIIALIVVILGIVLIINITMTPDKKIIKYIKAADYINYADTSIYSKQISENNIDQFNKDIKLNKESIYEINYFNTETLQLTKDKIIYKDGITKNITSTFDYTNNNLTYNYRIYYNNMNILIEGTYDINTKKFTCEPTYSYQIDIDKSIEDICNKIEFEIENFSYEAKILIKDPTLIKN